MPQLIGFVAWMAGLWWVMLIALVVTAVPLGPLIAVCYQAADDDADRPVMFGATRLLLLAFSWEVVGLLVSIICIVLRAVL